MSNETRKKPDGGDRMDALVLFTERCIYGAGVGYFAVCFVGNGAINSLVGIGLSVFLFRLSFKRK